MPEVNTEELKKKETEKKAPQIGIITKQVGEKTFFKGTSLETWFERYDECLNANQTAKEQPVKENPVKEAPKKASK